MEKFSQFRDRGSGISPFMPTSSPTSIISNLTSTILFAIRLPIFLAYTLLYFLFLHHLPLPAVAHKLLLWIYLSIPGIWWVDLQLDGVKRGSLSQQPPSRVPHPGSLIAANFTSPVDALYLAAVFDPVFVVSYPHSRKVQRISLITAIINALSPAPLSPPPNSKLTDLRTIVERHPNRVIAIFPESGTTNGKGILPLSPALLTVPTDAKIFPVSMRYTPPDITTPVPGAWIQFLWKLLGRPTHCIRVRIAEGMVNTTKAVNGVSSHEESTPAGEDGVTVEEQKLLDSVAEALARLGRAKRVGLTLKEKEAFVKAWNKRRR
ncbi:hypothetical protein QBC40DRAFT_346581 [Triangularia verruculosa]|uniref:Phospholipid/glycerol acyltransferase domain-containing protein n=1 Tax=Triangularia verruculosa TaxID=2587418 RepID=A0AAN6XSQ6_9PEZI|nr:hypothetical protein QBC40DRAFT_346581 [Triangularia verruculosa]